MPIETATTPSQLNTAWPADSDPVSQGAAHVRLVKTIVQSYNVPSGAIVAWHPTTAQPAIPNGWVACDGTNGTPDLRGAFVVGSGAVGNVPTDGSSVTITSYLGIPILHTLQYIMKL